MNIRTATLADAGMLSELGARTFSEAFAGENTPANLAAHLRNSFSPEIQHRELSQADTIFLIAEEDGQPVGYAQLLSNSREQGVEGSNPMEIRRIYVLQEVVGKGMGSKLMAASLNEARQRACDIVWLGVWEKNQRAIEFYSKWGFRQAGSHIFSLGDDPQTDLIMVLELSKPADGSTLTV
jgi:GNAT superfamily N-acetyltransferase